VYKNDIEGQNLKDKVVFINRVAKVVKGGRRFSFTALVVVGDGEGSVGVGKGKANEVPEAIRKAVETAKKSLVTFPIKDGTIPHRITGKFGGCQVVMNPAVKGTGIIAGGVVRSLFEVSGVSDINAKALGGHNPFNTINATMDGLLRLMDPDEVLKLRGKRQAAGPDVAGEQEAQGKEEPAKAVEAQG
jgi:small subunit ribosomal protein S5